MLNMKVFFFRPCPHEPCLFPAHLARSMYTPQSIGFQNIRQSRPHTLIVTPPLFELAPRACVCFSSATNQDPRMLPPSPPSTPPPPTPPPPPPLVGAVGWLHTAFSCLSCCRAVFFGLRRYIAASTSPVHHPFYPGRGLLSFPLWLSPPSARLFFCPNNAMTNYD